MILVKRRSFIIVEIESMELIDQKNNLFLEGIKEINKQQNFLDYIIILFYNFLKKFLSLLSIHNIYHTRFLIDNLK